MVIVQVVFLSTDVELNFHNLESDENEVKW